MEHDSDVFLYTHFQRSKLESIQIAQPPGSNQLSILNYYLHLFFTSPLTGILVGIVDDITILSLIKASNIPFCV